MIHELISERRSIRAFADKSIDDETLSELFEAARWAPSSRNEQPWRFIVSRKEERETFAKIISCLNENNRIWAQHGSVLFITLVKKTFSDNRQPNSHALHDVGQAIGNISFQATALNLFLHQMGGIDREKIKLVFEVPDDFDVVSVIVAGYRGNPEMLPENLHERELQPRIRKNLDELVFSNKFGEKNILVHKQI
jgi:nitroreductase